MKQYSKYAGMDVHRETIRVAVAAAGNDKYDSESGRQDRRSSLLLLDEQMGQAINEREGMGEISSISLIYPPFKVK